MGVGGFGSGKADRERGNVVRPYDWTTRREVETGRSQPSMNIRKNTASTKLIAPIICIRERELSKFQRKVYQRSD
jgi:hypothetical protein